MVQVTSHRSSAANQKHENTRQEVALHPYWLDTQLIHAQQVHHVDERIGDVAIIENRISTRAM